MERMLITKLVRTEQARADLYAKGHRWPDLKLFDVSDLIEVGIKPDDLPIGQEVPCRFWAIYELSEKTNKAGNAYRDVIALERVDGPATTTSTDTSAVVQELRAIRGLLQVLAARQGIPISTESHGPDWDAYPAAVDISDTDENDEQSETPVLDEVFGPRAEPPANNGDVPMTADELVAYVNRQSQHDAIKCTHSGHLLYGIKKIKGGNWGWPTDQAGWREAADAWLQYAASL